MDQLKARQDLYSGFGEAFARAFEFVMTPVLFGAIGWFLDRTFGTTPLFIMALSVFGLLGVGAKMYYTYKADMEAQEQDAPWARARRATADAPTVDPPTADGPTPGRPAADKQPRP